MPPGTLSSSVMRGPSSVSRMSGRMTRGPSAWPGGEPPLGAPAVNRVGGLVKLEQHAAQLLELLDGFLVERKRLRGDAPLVPGEEPAGGQALPDVLRDLFGRRLGVGSHQREPT